ncbi:MAG: 5-formyltetrahydrofolate cyclo-ligase [Pyrinomonadaceae bacterium]|nr:5-formyltetrahydrofolate cyclo-ligase [Pyrinomonadaceae bacterium]
MTKSELRKIYLDRQKSLSEVGRKKKSLQIAERFFASFDLAKTKFLHIFLPIEKNGEIDTFIFIERLRRDFPKVVTVTSKVDFETMTLENRRFDSKTKFVANRWQTLEPANGEPIEIKRIDVCLAPLLGFDERGFRVGYGKGFYDKFLSECRQDCLKIGLSYFPAAAISDVQEFDVPLDFCVTPLTVLNFNE